MNIVGYILLVLGGIVWVVGELMFLTVAYKRGLLLLFGCLFVPFVSFIFFLTNLRATAMPFAIELAGFLVVCLGGWMAGVEL